MTPTLSGRWDRFARLLLGGGALFYLWAAGYGILSLQYHRAIALLYMEWEEITGFRLSPVLGGSAEVGEPARVSFYWGSEG